jgi:hypothetical protein
MALQPLKKGLGAVGHGRRGHKAKRAKSMTSCYANNVPKKKIGGFILT